MVKPLRDKLHEQRRISFVRSTLEDTKDGPVYHVDIKEIPGAEKVTWIEKATQRDFAIGTSLAGLAVFAMLTATGGTAVIAPGLMILVGAVGGGISDFIRNDRELKEGVKIGEAKHFNRDTIKSALAYGFMAKLALVAICTAFVASGIAIPGIAVAQGGGMLAQFFSVADAIPNVVGWGVLGVGAALGAKKGSDIGYQRMQRDFTSAKTKNERPDLDVYVAPEPSLSVPEMVGNVVAPAIFPIGGLGDVVAGAQSALDQHSVKKEIKAWHPKEDQKVGFTFVNAVTSRQQNEHKQINETPEKIDTANGMVRFTRQGADFNAATSRQQDEKRHISEVPEKIDASNSITRFDRPVTSFAAKVEKSREPALAGLQPSNSL